MSVRLTGAKQITLPVYNNGLSEANLEFAKKSLLFDTIRNYSEFVNVDMEYPIKNNQNINLSVDMVIMSIVEFQELQANNKYLKFKNL